MNNNIEYIFKPKSIAVVGVSEDAHKLASIYFNNLVDAGFSGDLYPVNPKYQDLYGYKCYSKISDIPGEVDQVAILIPAQFVLDIIKDCAQKNVKTVLIISAGFGELGEAGKVLEQEIVAVAKASGIRILGPNIIGVINTYENVNSSWMQLFPDEGNVSFLSQSGAFCTAVLDRAINTKVGFANFCSIGNKADIDENDLINYWYQDPKVKVIGAYLEEIAEGYSLLKYLNTNEVIKPIILFKPGKTNAAVKAISSHTGSMAGSVETISAAINQSPLIEVNSMAEMMSNFMSFSRSHIPQGNRIAIITNAGGPGIMATDAIIQENLQLAELSDYTKSELKKTLPAAASVSNPVDILGDALAERYLAATNIVLQDPAVDMIMYIVTPQFITQIEDTAKMIIRLKKSTTKPVFTVFLGEKYVSIGIERMNDAQVPVFDEVVMAVKSIADLVKYGNTLNNRDLAAAKQKYSFVDNTINQGKYSDEITALLKKDEQVSVPDDLIARIAVEVGLDTPKQLLACNLVEAKEFAAEHYPVVIKAPNELLAHKTDFKAVFVNLQNEIELENAYNELVNTVTKATGNNNPQILIQEMIKYQEEIFIGANRDGGAGVYADNGKGFGHLIITGKGGIYTEVYKDIAHILVPINRQEAETAFNTTKVSQIVHGVRGQAPLAFTKLIDAIEAVQKLVLLYPQVASMDINPILLNADRAVAVDIKLFVKP